MELLRSRRWLRRICCFYKLMKTQKPLYLFNLIPPKLIRLCHPNAYSIMRCRNDYCKNSFIPYVVREWNKLSIEIRNSTYYQQLRKSLLTFIKPTLNQPLLRISPYSVQMRENTDKNKSGYGHFSRSDLKHPF